jgi:hypothetical protein
MHQPEERPPAPGRQPELENAPYNRSRGPEDNGSTGTINPAASGIPPSRGGPGDPPSDDEPEV